MKRNAYCFQKCLRDDTAFRTMVAIAKPRKRPACQDFWSRRAKGGRLSMTSLSLGTIPDSLHLWTDDYVTNKTHYYQRFKVWFELGHLHLKAQPQKKRNRLNQQEK